MRHADTILIDTIGSTASDPSPTDAPFSLPGEFYVCLSCHAADTTRAINSLSSEIVKPAIPPIGTICGNNTVIPTPTDAPYGTSGEMFNCFSCHGVDTMAGSTVFTQRGIAGPATMGRGPAALTAQAAPPVVVPLVDILPGSDEMLNLKARGVLLVPDPGLDGLRCYPDRRLCSV
jgi:hypothetical protein